MQTPTIETERMILRPLQLKDAPLIFERWTADPRVTKFMSYNTHKNVDETKEWLTEEESHINDNSAFSFAFELKDSHYLFGSGGLYFKDELGMYELGYNIMYDYWNKGYTTEAAKAIANFAKEQLKVKALFARHAVEKPASGRVMEKTGFVHTDYGTITSYDGQRTYKAKQYNLEF